MIRRSTLVAVVALALSLIIHFLALALTTRMPQQQSGNAQNTDVVELGNAFEDIAEPVAQPVAPEPAPTPEPEAEQPPADRSTSEALVASDNPQNVAAPDTGSALVPQPETTGAAQPQPGDSPAPASVEPSAGAAEAISDARLTPPAGTDPVNETPQGVDTGVAEPVVTAPAEPESAPSQLQQFAALPVPVVPVPDSATVPVVPLPSDEAEAETPVPPDAPDTEEAESAPASTAAAITSSLRPQLRAERQIDAQEGLPDGSPRLSETRRAPSELIESPLTAYQRDGTNLFAGRSGGTRSGGLGFVDSRGPGNADVTNYAGQVLVHLNRVPPVAVASRGWARVFFVINPDGSLASVAILDGSGSLDVERAARAQVRNAAPFPSPPDGKRRQLTFYYRIQQGAP